MIEKNPKIDRKYLEDRLRYLDVIEDLRNIKHEYHTQTFNKYVASYCKSVERGYSFKYYRWIEGSPKKTTRIVTEELYQKFNNKRSVDVCFKELSNILKDDRFGKDEKLELLHSLEIIDFMKDKTIDFKPRYTFTYFNKLSVKQNNYINYKLGGGTIFDKDFYSELMKVLNSDYHKVKELESKLFFG